MTISWLADKIEQWPTAKLVPYARNSRTHSDAQVAQIAASIAEFGFTNPILAGGDGVIVAGHGRLAAAQKLGLAMVPVVVLDHLTPTQRRALVIADNRIAENASWDEAMLQVELAALQDDQFDLALTGFDADALAEQPYVDGVSPSANTSVTLRFKDTEASATVNGVSEDFFYVKGMTFKSGQAFDKNSVMQRAQDVVIDTNTEKTFFADGTNPVGQVLLLGSVPSRIIGVVDAQQGFMGGSDSLNVYLPYSTVMSRMLGQANVRSIIVRIKDEYPSSAAENAILTLLEQRHGAQDVFTQNSDSIRETIQQTTATMTLLISAIAVISLVVGGIGVMNIMLVSVTERTQEIGVRMAVGARQSDILQQFLIEAILVCLLGGVLGVLLSLGIGQIISHFAKDVIQMSYSTTSIIAAFVCSSLIGIVFGFLPAQNAAQLDPVAALARE